MKTAVTRRMMTASEIAARVAELAPRFLEGLAPCELAVILRAATLRRFQAHSLVANEGRFANKLFLILDGRARTFTTTREGEKVLLLWVSPGEVSGGKSVVVYSNGVSGEYGDCGGQPSIGLGS